MGFKDWIQKKVIEKTLKGTDKEKVMDDTAYRYTEMWGPNSIVNLR